MSQKKSHLVKKKFIYIYHAQAIENQKKKKKIKKEKKRRGNVNAQEKKNTKKVATKNVIA